MSRDPKDWLTIMAQCHVRVLRHHTLGVGMPSNAISHDRLSAIVGGSGLADSCVRERKTKTLVLGPLRFLLVIRKWLGLRDLVQDAGTFPFCRAVV